MFNFGILSFISSTKVNISTNTVFYHLKYGFRYNSRGMMVGCCVQRPRFRATGIPQNP